MLKREVHGSVAVLRLAHGRASAFDVDFLRALSKGFELEAHSESRALVVTGSDQIFSAGVDLLKITSNGPDYVYKFLLELDRFFETLIRLEKPLVGAVNGHAIAGGCLIASTCDIRLMAAGKGRIGVPELKVGVPFPLSAFEIMRNTLSPANFREVMFLGKTYEPGEALGRGLIDEVVEPTDLMPRAIARAEELASFPASAFALNKRMLWQPVLDRLASHGAKQRE